MRILAMVNTLEAVEAINEGRAELVVCDCAPLENEPTGHSLYRYSQEELVAPLLPEVESVPDAAEGIRQVLHYGTDYKEMYFRFTGREYDDWDDDLELPEIDGYTQTEDNEGPWGWTLDEYNNAKFGEEG